jgi:hypothetical protein
MSGSYIALLGKRTNRTLSVRANSTAVKIRVCTPTAMTIRSIPTEWAMP